MDQQIRFCTASDGVSIAYATLGSGSPLVYVCGWPTHLEMEWEKPFSRAFLEELADGCTLIRYDMRGSGLSDRDVSDLSLEVLCRDLEAVVDHLELERFALLSLGVLAGPIAIVYAATHQERVSHLILSSAFTQGRKILTPERQRALIDYVRAFGYPYRFTDADQATQRDVQRLGSAASTHEVQAALLETFYSVDVADRLTSLTLPALVIHGRRDTVVPIALGRELAAQLPDATFMPFEGSSGSAWAGSHITIPKIRSFVGIESVAAGTPRAISQSLVTILFTDMESSTALRQHLGDEKAQELVRTHNAIVRDALRAQGGSEIKHTGDGIMASFGSASGALSCAVAIQLGAAGHTAAHPEAPLSLYIGLNAGEPIAEESDLFGTSVDLAKRICDQAEPGEILATDVVRQLAAGKGFLFADRGETVLRGFEDPVRVYELGWRDE